MITIVTSSAGRQILLSDLKIRNYHYGKHLIIEVPWADLYTDERGGITVNENDELRYPDMEVRNQFGFLEFDGLVDIKVVKEYAEDFEKRYKAA